MKQIDAMGFINDLCTWLLNACGKVIGIFLGFSQENTNHA